MSTEVEEVRRKLAKRDEQVAKLRKTTAELAHNLPALNKKCKHLQEELEEERQRRAMAEAALEQLQREVQEARKHAAAAAVAAAASERKVQEALSSVQAQVARLQQACDNGDLGAGGGAQQQQQQQQQGLQLAALQAQVDELQRSRQQVDELQRRLQLFGSAALPHLAELAGASGLQQAALPPARPAGAAAASGQRQGSAHIPPPPQQQQQAQQRQHQRQRGPASPRHTLPAASPPAAAGPPQPDDARAKAVAARQATAAAAAAAGGGASGGKRPRGAAQAAPARASGFAEALGTVGAAGGRPAAKRPRGQAGVAADAASPRARQPQQESGGGGGGALAPFAAPAAEASLAISGNEVDEGGQQQQREQMSAADEAAQLLSRITSGGGGGGGSSLGLPDVHQVAADLHLRLVQRRLPQLLLLSCFETAVLGCAAPRPQLQYVAAAAAAAAAVEGEGGGQQAAACSSTDAWFAFDSLGQQQQRRRQEEGDASSSGQPFAAVWCSQEAFACHRLQWLLHCAARLQYLQQQREAAAAALEGRQHGVSGGFVAQLQQYLHRVVLQCLLSSSSCGFGSVRHTETEVCALAAAAAGLCRAGGNPEALLALLLDLLSCQAPAATVLPPLVAAMDMWPAMVEAAAASKTAAGGLVSGDCLQAALQHLCAQAGECTQPAAADQPHAAATDGTDLPQLLLLERQPAAAAVILQRLGRRRLGWEPSGRGSAHALQLLRTAARDWGHVPAAAVLGGEEVEVI